MSDWTWEYMPDAQSVVGGLDVERRAEVEALAQRIADAVAVRRIGESFDPANAVSSMHTYAEGGLMLVYQEDYRDDTILVSRVQSV
ncbi:hypothetical protein [Phaeacidiphilus oryzae]|jgi:hypothetical protein|uniref:hypothetical protein n=1 Tax=Phaeacidiphilus oryzae TaxID=348818 RepID=UPI00055C3A73|nr:hypothetical protein [Phaeacidiphilus oryzae]